MSSDKNYKITGTALKQVVLKFIPPQFIKNVNLSKLGFDNPEVLPDGGVGLLKKLMEKSTDDIRIFGTAEDLTNAVHDYRQFPSSHRYFGNDISEEYYIAPELLTNDAMETYICKQDLFVMLQKQFFFKFRNTNQLARSALSIYLKTCEQKLNGCCEYVKYDQKFIDSIDIESKELINCRPSCSPRESSFDDICNEWRGWLTGWTDEQFKPIRRALRTHFEQFPPDAKSDIYISAAFACKVQLNLLHRTIRDHPKLFLPATSAIFPIPIRVFRDSGQTFVMIAEVKKAWDFVYPEHKFNYKDPDGYVEIIKLDDAKHEYINLFPKLELLHHSIYDAKFKATPIMTPTGDFCIYGAGAFQQIVHQLSVVLKIFQKIKKDKWHLVEEYMKWLEKELNISVTRPHFVTLNKLEHILQYTTDFFKEFKNVPAKSVQIARKINFSIGDYKKELRRLELMDVLPDFLNCAQDVYDIMMSRKANRLPTARDIIKAIELYQYNSLIRMFPEVFFDRRTKSTNCNSLKKEEKSENGLPIEQAEGPNDDGKVVEVLEKNSENASNESTEIPSQVAFVEDSCQNCQKLMKQIEEEVEKKGNETEINGSAMIGESSNSSTAQHDEQLKRQSTALVNSNKEIDILKSKLSKYEDNEEKLKETNKKLMETKNQLTKRVTNLESQVKNEKQKIHKIEQESEQQRIDFNRKFSVLQSEYEKEVTDKNSIFEDNLKRKNLEIENLNRKLSALQLKYDKDMVAKRNDDESTGRVSALEAELKRNIEFTSQNIAQLESKLVEKSSEVEKLTEKYEEMKNLRQLDDMKNRNLEGLTASLKRTILNHEVTENGLRTRNQQLETQLEREKQRTQELAQQMVPNLQRLAGGQMDLSFDQEVLNKNKEINELQSTNDRLTIQNEQQNMMIKAFFEQFGQVKKSYLSSSTQTTQSDSIDSECLICLIEMTSDEKTMKCESCRKVLHLECASEWLKRHRSCPHCRRELLDPNEFPALG